MRLCNVWREVKRTLQSRTAIARMMNTRHILAPLDRATLLYFQARRSYQLVDRKKNCRDDNIGLRGDSIMS